MLLNLYFRDAIGLFFSVNSLQGDDFKQGRDEDFFEVSKAKPFGNLGDGRGEGGWEGDGVVGSEFVSEWL